MSSFVPTNYDLRTALVFCYHLKKTAAESHRMLVEAYGEYALGKTQCFEWFKKFLNGNFDVRNEDRGKPPKKCVLWDQKGVIYYTGQQGFVVEKLWVVSGVIFDVESESAYHVRILRYLRLCARKMGFFATFEVKYRAQEIFLVFPSNVII